MIHSEQHIQEKTQNKTNNSNLKINTQNTNENENDNDNDNDNDNEKKSDKKHQSLTLSQTQTTTTPSFGNTPNITPAIVVTSAQTQQQQQQPSQHTVTTLTTQNEETTLRDISNSPTASSMSATKQSHSMSHHTQQSHHSHQIDPLPENYDQTSNYQNKTNIHTPKLHSMDTVTTATEMHVRKQSGGSQLSQKSQKSQISHKSNQSKFDIKTHKKVNSGVNININKAENKNYVSPMTLNPLNISNVITPRLSQNNKSEHKISGVNKDDNSKGNKYDRNDLLKIRDEALFYGLPELVSLIDS